MMRPNGTDLPPELVDAIIDFSHCDRLTLAKCSLVSKTWLPTSRLHLFEHVLLTSANFPAFLALCDTAHCSILPYIHVVTLSGAGWKSLRAAISSLTILTQLETLRFVKITFHPPGPTSIPSFHNIKALDLTQAVFETFAHLTEVVATFPAIEQLRIDNSEWSSYSGGSLAPAPSSLDAIDVGRCSKMPIFHWLVGSPSTLKSVNLSLFRTTELRPAVQYLRNLGPSLEHFELTQFIGCWASEDFAKKMDLTHNTHLLSVHLHLYPRQPTIWIPALLSQVRSSKITDLILTIHGDTKVVFRTTATQRGIESALEEPQFVSLKRVRILLGGRQPAGRELDVVRRLFPLCTRRGLL